MLEISTPITDAPWYLAATGSLNIESMDNLATAIEAARDGELFCPVLDLTQVRHVAAAVSNQLTDMVERGEVSLLGSAALHQNLLPRERTVLDESRLEATEAILALVRRRRHDGVADNPVITQLLERIRRGHTQ